jgi:hypothetical protein
MEEPPVFNDARTITTTIEAVETDHNDGSIDQAVHAVSLSTPMILAIEGAFQTLPMRQAAQEHAGDPCCPYPHTADDLTRCVVLASYLKRDVEEHEGALKAAARAQDAKDREAQHQRDLLADRRKRRDEIARGQPRRNG